MIIHDVEQGSEAWLQLRLGIPTASDFKKIVTPTGNLSKQSFGYMCLLIAEKILNRQLQTLDNLEWIVRGKELEPKAVKMYEFEQEVETTAVGFITTDDGLIGASPDRLIVGKRAGVECKCPAPQTHIAYMLEDFGDDYKCQVQGQMLVGEFDFVDRYSYHPELPPHLCRTYRDDPFIRLLDSSLREFNDNLRENYEKIKSQGFFADQEFRTAHESAYVDQIAALTDPASDFSAYTMLAG